MSLLLLKICERWLSVRNFIVMLGILMNLMGF